MKKYRKAAKLAGISVISSVLILGALVVLFRSQDQAGNIFDIFGRRMYEKGGLASLLGPGPSILWRIFDFIVFFGGLGLGWKLLDYGDDG